MTYLLSMMRSASRVTLSRARKVSLSFAQPGVIPGMWPPREIIYEIKPTRGNHALAMHYVLRSAMSGCLLRTPFASISAIVFSFSSVITQTGR